MNENQKLVKILSIDGGGIRGIIPGQVLVSLEEKLKSKSGTDKGIAEYFDLIAGTSTGGILTCILLCPSDENPAKPKFSAKEAVNLYLENGGKIFHRSFWQRVGRAGGLWNEKYSALHLELSLLEKLNHLHLSQLIKPCIITAYEINKRYAHFFTQHNAVTDESYDYEVKDVARATSAAPTYFEVARVKSITKDEYYLVDGGVFANNPTLCAYSEARTMQFDGDSSNPTAAEMAILSLGTGTYEKPYTYRKTRRWGMIRWIKPIIDIMMSGVAETVDHQLSEIYDAVKKKEQYMRIDPELKEAIDMDDASKPNIEFLKNAGSKCALENDAELDRFADLLINM
jgi:patatin-like phospholipase/acyl hydrolase